MSFSFDIKGQDKIQKALARAKKDLVKRVDSEVKTFVVEINKAQVQAASRFTDRGQLIKGIGWEKVKDTDAVAEYVLFSQAPYSAYLEFGTRKKFRAIPGVDASQFQGKGSGDYYDFLNAILDWVKRKGIASTYSTGIVKNKGGKKSGYSLDLTKSGKRKTRKEDLLRVAEAIALYIMRNGINPQPFFFAPFLSRREELKRRIEVIVNNPLG